MNEILNNPVMQIVIALVMVSFVVMEARSWVRAFRKMGERHTAGAAFPQLPLVRPFSFLHNCAGNADAALMTLIAMDLLAGSPLEENALLLALPLTITYLGYFISGPLRMAVVGRTSLRFGLVLSSAGTLASFAFIAAGVVASSFWTYIVALFANRCFYYLLASCVRFMSSSAPSEGECIEAFTENANADVSSAALIGLATGFAAQYLGNVYAYLIAMVPTLVLTLMVVRLVPRDMVVAPLPARRAKTSSSLKGMLTFLRQPSILALLFFALVTLGFSGCYRSYLFPIFADYGGLNKAAISTITVFCSALIFYTAPPLTRLAHRIGPRKLLTATLVACACVFLGFLITGTLAWAVVALFLVFLIKKVGEPCAQTLWPRVADDVGISRAEGQASYEVLDGIVSLAKTPAMGVLLTFGQVVICAIVGIYAFVSAAGFWITTNSGPFSR